MTKKGLIQKLGSTLLTGALALLYGCSKGQEVAEIGPSRDSNYTIQTSLKFDHKLEKVIKNPAPKLFLRAADIKLEDYTFEGDCLESFNHTDFDIKEKTGRGLEYWVHKGDNGDKVIDYKECNKITETISKASLTLPGAIVAYTDPEKYKEMFKGE